MDYVRTLSENHLNFIGNVDYLRTLSENYLNFMGKDVFLSQHCWTILPTSQGLAMGILGPTQPYLAKQVFPGMNLWYSQFTMEAMV